MKRAFKARRFGWHRPLLWKYQIGVLRLVLAFATATSRIIIVGRIPYRVVTGRHVVKGMIVVVGLQIEVSLVLALKVKDPQDQLVIRPPGW
jgi:hypothetical protein